MTAPPKVIAFAVVLAGLTGSPVWARHHHRPRTLRMEATAYAQDSKPTASGTIAHEGIVAADPAVLPFGTRIRVTGAGAYNGIYTVTDTGGKIGRRHIDIYVPTRKEAKLFGRKRVKVEILEVGSGKRTPGGKISRPQRRDGSSSDSGRAGPRSSGLGGIRCLAPEAPGSGE